MGKNNLDKVVKDKLYDLNTPINTNDLWSGIQTKMDNEKTEAKPAFSFRKYLGLGLLAFMLFGSTYLLYNQFGNNTIDENMTSAVDNKSIDDTSVNVGNTSNNTNINKSSLATTELDNGVISLYTNTTKQATSANANSNSNSNSNKRKRKLNNTANQNNNEQIRSNSSASANSTVSTSESNSANQIDEDQLTSKLTPTSGNSPSENSSNIYGSEKTNTSELNITDKNTNSSDTEKRFQNSLINAINRLDRKENVGISFGRETVDICSRRNRIDCYDAWTEDNKFSIVPYVGVDFVTNDRIRTDSFANYLQERDNTMRFLEVIKAGLLVKYNVTPNLYVKVGAEYNQIREVFESTTVETIEEVVDDVIIGYTISIEGDTFPVTGEAEQIRIITTKWRKFNKYHSLNIPVILGFQAPIGNGWAYFTEAGVFYNVRFTYEGTLLDQDGLVVSGENYYLNNTGVSLYGALGISYNFNDKIAAFATGSYKYNLEPINNADYNPIKQNLGLAGVAIGLEIRL